MRLGFGLPQVGALATVEAVVAVATRAEALGFDDVWVFDRVLWPLAPRTKYPASADGRLPEAVKTVLDPLATLTFVAAQTRRVGLGTSVLNLPYYNPVLLARQLSTLDVLSGGRVQVGLGTGWSLDEFEAVGARMPVRAKQVDEAVQVLKAIWTTDPVEFEGEFYRVPASVIYPKPIQKPHPPLLFAAYSPAAMRRVARLADGWLPAGISAAGLQQMFEDIKGMAREAGRDPNRLQLVVRGNVALTTKALGSGRPPFAGSAEEIRADIAGIRALGAHGLHLDAQSSRGAQSLDGLIARMEELWSLAQAG